MKHLLLLLSLTLFTAPAQAQQVNVYGVCTQYREVYRPGGYDYNGNYVQGGVYTESYNVPCAPTSVYNAPAPAYAYPSRRTCAAAPLGAILGGVGAYAATSKPNNRWWSVPLGVLTGSIIGTASCN